MIKKFRNFTNPLSTLLRYPVYISYTHYRFSTIAKNVMTDWQYNSKIQQLLKQNNINEALRYLVNSFLDDRVLDRHIFRQYFLKVQQNQYGISYQEIGYKLYRQYFKPHILVLDWMNSLARSRDEGIWKLLPEDFQTINFTLPNVEKVNEQEEDKKYLKYFTQQHHKGKESDKNTDNTKINKNKTDQETKIKIKTYENENENNNQDKKKLLKKQKNCLSDLQLDMYGKQQLLTVVKQLGNVLLDLNPKIIFHNVEIQYTNFKQQQEQINFSKNQQDQYIMTNQLNSNISQIQHDHLNRQEYDNQLYEEDDQYFQQRIEKIKIGRIQITARKDNQEAIKGKDKEQ